MSEVELPGGGRVRTVRGWRGAWRQRTVPWLALRCLLRVHEVRVPVHGLARGRYAGRCERCRRPVWVVLDR